MNVYLKQSKNEKKNCFCFSVEKMFLIRYEDLSLEPFSTTDRLLEFLDLKPNKLIDQFLESHTKTKRPGFTLYN